MIRVFNLHEFEKQWPGRRHYVGPDSVLENRFGVRSGNSRAEGIELFRHWLWGVVKDGMNGAIADEERRKVWEALQAIRQDAQAGDVSLLCICKPLACHGDVIRSAVEWMDGKKTVER